MNKQMLAFWFGLLGTIFFITSTIIAGALFPGYSHIINLISESYAIDTAYGIPIRFFGFLPSGVFVFLFSLFAIKSLPKSPLNTFGFLAIGIFYGLGTVVVSFFPCDSGCNPELIDPSISQLIHNTSGFFTYLIVPMSLILLGISAQKWNNGKTISIVSFFFGIIAFVFAFILSANLTSEYAGLLQRIVESSILACVVIYSFYFKRVNKAL